MHGLGLFATEDIPPGYDFGVSHVEDSRFPDGYVRTPLGAFINHSYTPNCTMPETEGIYRLISAKKVKKGDELTVDYTPWYEKSALAAFK